jgi:hypothetical protein
MKILVAAAATLLVAPQFAMADDIEEQLRLMDERMGQLESQLQATQDELQASKTTVAAQQELIEKAGIEREAQSGLSAFLSQTQFDGFVAASYTYNFIGTDKTRQVKYAGTLGGNLGAYPYYGYYANGINNGTLGLTAPLHPNNNTFQVDQVWFGMRKPATAESRGGWAVDLVWGVGADNLGTPESINSEVGVAANAVATGDLPHLYQAYVEYLAPLGDTFIKAGRFQTLIGAEEFRQDRNFNVTRGLLWTVQPENHTGVLVGSEYDSGLTWTVGVANSYSATMADADHEKTFLGQLGYRGETFSLLLNGLYGGNPSDVPLFMNCREATGLLTDTCEGKDGDSVALIDLVATWEPTESLSAWINFDYYWFNNAGEGPNATSPFVYDFDRMNVYGIATAVRWGFLENTGVAVRFEWLRAETHPYWLLANDFIDPGEFDSFGGRNLNLFSLTGTIDHALTDNLTLRVEGRYDWAEDDTHPDDFFTTARPIGYDNYTRQDQGMGLVEMLYRF